MARAVMDGEKHGSGRGVNGGWGLGTGDWGLGTGDWDWGMRDWDFVRCSSPMPNFEPPVPSPQSPTPSTIRFHSARIMLYSAGDEHCARFHPARRERRMRAAV